MTVAAAAVVVILALVIAAVPGGASRGGQAPEAMSAMAQSTEVPATGSATEAPTADVATPAMLVSSGRGSGPLGDAGGARAYAGPGPTGDVEVAWRLSIPFGYRAGSPVAYGDRLLVTASSEAFGSNLTVYDLDSGRFLWNYAESAIFSDPFVAGGRVFLSMDHAVVALSLESGESLWTRHLEDPAHPDEAVSNPVADGEAVVVTVGSDVVAMDAATGEELWRRAFAGAQVYWPRLVGDVVAVVSQDRDTSAGRYHGISLESGNELWRQDALAPHALIGSVDAGVVIVEDLLGGDLRTRMFDARTGLPEMGAAGCADETPIAAGDVVTCGTLDVRTGEPLPGAGSWPEGGDVSAGAGDLFYVAGDSRVVAVDRASGEARWSLDLANIPLDEGQTLTGIGVVSVGASGAAIEVRLNEAGGDGESREIWILAAVTEPAATPVALATPVGDATPEQGE
jgi:outer membrane protein assembly factor BamB